MKTFQQARFAPPAELLEDEPLVIHRRRDSPRNTSLVIFVHGLGGSRYGKRSTWSSIPKFVLEDMPFVDVGMHAYTSFVGRWKFWKSLPLEREAEVLASEIRRLKKYHRIVLVGHSMGGLLSLLTAEALAGVGSSRRANGIVLVAAPQAGSSWIPRFLRWISFDALALARTGEIARRTQGFIKNSCEVDEVHTSPTRTHLPLWAIVAANDLWVDRFSSELNVPKSQTSTVRGTHTGILKSQDKERTAIQTLLEYICRAVSIEVGDSEWSAVPARSDDLLTVHSLAVSELEPSVSPLALMNQWLGRNPNLFWLIVHTIVGGSTSTRTVLGYFCLIPITDDAARRMRQGKLAGNAFAVSDILPSVQNDCTIYVGGIAANDDNALIRQHTLALAIRTLETWAQSYGRITLITRPISAHGLRVALRRGFAPVDPARQGLNALHWRTMP